MELLISLVSGAVGGNAAGALLKNMNLGLLGNSIAGIVGGGIGGQLLGMLGAPDLAAAAELGGLDLGSVIGQVAAGGAGGGALLAAIGLVRNALGK